MKFFAMQDRTVRDLLGSIVDSRPHPPPKSIHWADSEATFGRASASIHDDSSSVENPRARAGTGRLDQPSRTYRLSKRFLKSDTDAHQCKGPSSVKPSIQSKKARAAFPFLP